MKSIMKKDTLLHLNLARLHNWEVVDVDDLEAVLLVLVLVDALISALLLS